MKFRLALSDKTSDAAARSESDAVETKAPRNSWPAGEQQFNETPVGRRVKTSRQRFAFLDVKEACRREGHCIGFM